MKHLLKNRTTVALTVLAIVLLGAAVGWWRADQRRAEILGELLDNAERCAIAFDAAELRQLAGTRADAATAVYRSVKDRLRRFQAVDPDVRFVYIFRHLPATGQVIFLGDSETPGGKDESQPGDVYKEAGESPGLQAIIADGRPATEGPLGDAFGTWVTGYALIGTPQPGEPREILGFDLSAANWYTKIWGAGLSAAGYVWLLLGIPLASLRVIRRQREQRAAIRNLSEAMEQSHTAVMIVDPGNCIEYANRGLCDQTGYSRRELIGRPWREFQAPETPAETISDLVTTLRSGRSWHGEWFNRRKDGSHYPVRGVVTPVKHRDGSLACFVAVLEDTTVAKRVEAEMREARERAEAGDRAKGQFLATMSHEVRTPLNGIVGFSELLLESALPGDQREYAEAIRASADTLLRLTGDILDFARIESGKLKLEPHPAVLRELIEGTLDLLAAPAFAKNIELLHWIEPDVPAALQVDAGRLRQVLVNLVNNAVKFTAAGEIALNVRVLPPDPSEAAGTPAADRVHLEFTVRDTGIGIPADQQHRLFQPFSQVDGGSTRRYGGTGLGLAISKSIVQMMDGGISLASEPGRGSVFTFTIRVPAGPAAAPPGAGRPLEGRRMALVVGSPGLRGELARVGAAWGAEVILTEWTALFSTAADLAIVEVGDALLTGAISTRLPPLARSVALVPLTWPTSRRDRLRPHFQALVNKPLHYGKLLGVLVGQPAAVAAVPVAGKALPLRVLLVEDNAVNQRLMQAVLTNLGCRWAVAGDGRQALARLQAEPCDVVLMDLHMPEMDGLTATRMIRAGEAGAAVRDVWIVMLTADTDDETRKTVLAVGANGFLTKPLQRSELLAQLEAFAESRRAAGPVGLKP